MKLFFFFCRKTNDLPLTGFVSIPMSFLLKGICQIVFMGMFLCVSYSENPILRDHWKSLAQHHFDQGEEQKAFKAAFNALHEASKKESPLYLNRIGYLFFHFGKDLGDAEGFFKQALQIDPYHRDSLVGVGDVYFRRNLWISALDWYELARKYHPRDPVIHSSIAACFYERAQYNQAMFHYQESLGLNSEDLVSLNNLANIYYDLNRIDEARSLYEKALQIKPEFLPALQNLAVLELDQKHYSRSLKLFQKSMSLDPDDGGVHTNLASLYFEIRQTERAKYHLRRAIAIEDSAVAHNNLAVVQKFTDEELGAGVEYVKALRRKWNYSNARRHSAFFRRRSLSILESMRSQENIFRIREFASSRQTGRFTSH